MLMSKGFITPSALHYVRNHGAVPKLDWDTHRISVGGMVDRPATFSIPELLELLPSYTIPVTLVCAGVAAPPQRKQRIWNTVLHLVPRHGCPQGGSPSRAARMSGGYSGACWQCNDTYDTQCVFHPLLRRSLAGYPRVPGMLPQAG